MVLLWSTNMLANAISLGVGVFGILLSCFFYLRSRKRKNPMFCTRTARLIREGINQIGGLEIYYDSRKLSALLPQKLLFGMMARRLSQRRIFLKNTP